MAGPTWAWPPPAPLPLPPPLPPPLPACLCCWEPVISAILLSICSSRSRMDILNWLSRAEQGRGCILGEKHLTSGLCQLPSLASKNLSVSNSAKGGTTAGQCPQHSTQAVSRTPERNVHSSPWILEEAPEKSLLCRKPHFWVLASLFLCGTLHQNLEEI